MIKKVTLKYFKMFQEASIELDSHVIFAGQNNSGKTTVIQAIAAWHFALNRWIESNKKENAIGLMRKEFSPVPIREFNQLWTNTSTALKGIELAGKHPGMPRLLEITVEGVHGEEEWSLTMAFRYANKDQIYAKPIYAPGETHKIPDGARKVKVSYIPSFSGISIEEPERNRAYQDTLIGQGRPGEILRNLLQEISEQESGEHWENLCKHIREIFGYELGTPSPSGVAFILCEYRQGKGKPLLDINTAGSGFQQVLLLLAFLYARPATTLLIDEPDAHLHIYLQKKIYNLIKDIAKKQDAQVIFTTHSNVLISITDPREIISFFGSNPHPLSNDHDRDKLERALELTSSDLLNIEETEGKILFLEGSTDYNILLAWAKVLKHPMYTWLENGNYCRYLGGENIKSELKRFEGLQAIRNDVRAFALIDGDNDEKTLGLDQRPSITLKKWTRYEIENYLFHRDAIMRFINKKFSAGDLFINTKIRKNLEQQIPPVVLDNPLQPHDFLIENKGSQIFKRVFDVPDYPDCKISKKGYCGIAEVMKPEEDSPRSKRRARRNR